MSENLEKTEYIRQLRRKIKDHFNLEEVQVLCTDVGVVFDELPGEGLTRKSNELILYLGRRGRLDDLVTVLKEERPNVDWEEIIPTAEQQIQDAEKLIPPAKDDLILREYLERLEQFLPKNGLEKAKDDKHLQTIIYNLTETYMKQLDLWRRVHLIRHLCENNLQTVVSLKGVELEGADLSGVNLHGANLAYAKLNTTFLVSSNLQDANLCRAQLNDAHLQRANLKGANLDHARLAGADFTEADLRDVSVNEFDTRYIYGSAKKAPILTGTYLNNVFLLREKVEIGLRKRDFETALQDAIVLCDLDSENKWHYFLRGVAYEALGNEGSAKKDFIIAVELPEGESLAKFLFDKADCGPRGSTRVELQKLINWNWNSYGCSFNYKKGSWLTGLCLSLIIDVCTNSEEIIAIKKKIY